MKDIKGYEGLYAADKSGKIWSYPKKVGEGKHSGKFLKPRLDKRGYNSVMLYKEKQNKQFLIHRLIAHSFLKNPFDLKEIDHKDTNKSNNSIENLEWVTSKENHRRAWALGLYEKVRTSALKGSANSQSKLTENKVKIIKQRINNGEVHRIIAKDFGVHRSTITCIRRGIIWKHVN